MFSRHIRLVRRCNTDSLKVAERRLQKLKPSRVWGGFFVHYSGGSV